MTLSRRIYSVISAVDAHLLGHHREEGCPFVGCGCYHLPVAGTLVLPSLGGLWQHSPQMAADDPVESARAQAIRLNQQSPWWLDQLKSAGITVLVIIGGVYWLSSSMSKLQTELSGSVQRLDERIGHVEKDLDQHRHFHQTGVGADSTPPIASTAPAVPSGSPSESTELTKANNRSIPGSVKPRDPPVCISKTARRAFACERAKAGTCFGPEAFEPVYFRNLRKSSGQSDTTWVMVCEEKSATPEPPPKGSN